MSKIVVDKLPEFCSECPLYAYFYPMYHPERDTFRQCPLKEEHPNCLDRFVELLNVPVPKELFNAKRKETDSR